MKRNIWTTNLIPPSLVALPQTPPSSSSVSSVAPEGAQCVYKAAFLPLKLKTEFGWCFSLEENEEGLLIRTWTSLIGLMGILVCLICRLLSPIFFTVFNGLTFIVLCITSVAKRKKKRSTSNKIQLWEWPIKAMKFVNMTSTSFISFWSTCSIRIDQLSMASFIHSWMCVWQNM